MKEEGETQVNATTFYPLLLTPLGRLTRKIKYLPIHVFEPAEIGKSALPRSLLPK